MLRWIKIMLMILIFLISGACELNDKNTQTNQNVLQIKSKVSDDVEAKEIELRSNPSNTITED